MPHLFAELFFVAIGIFAMGVIFMSFASKPPEADGEIVFEPRVFSAGECPCCGRERN